MFTRRTLALFAAVAALTGGVAGGLTSTVTNPQSAEADYTKVLRKTPKTVDQMIKITYDNSGKMSVQLDRIEQKQAALDNRLGAIEFKLNQIENGVNGVGRLVHGPDGRTLGNILMSIEAELD